MTKKEICEKLWNMVKVAITMQKVTAEKEEEAEDIGLKGFYHGANMIYDLWEEDVLDLLCVIENEMKMKK